MAELWASIGAIWRDMLLAEALVCERSLLDMHLDQLLKVNY